MKKPKVDNFFKYIRNQATVHLKIIFKNIFYGQVINIFPGYYKKYIIFLKLKKKLNLSENYTT